METYLYLLATKWNNGKIAEIMFADCQRNTCSHFISDDKGSAAIKLCKLLKSFKWIVSDKLLAPEHEVRFIGFDPSRSLRAVWAESIHPDDRGCFPYMLPIWMGSHDLTIDLGTLFGRVNTPWPEFLKSRGLTKFPEGWTDIGTNLDFEIGAVTALVLQLGLINQTAKLPQEVAVAGQS